jgi:hypothetical protein
MYIISRKAVYAVHWYENASFAPGDDWRHIQRREISRQTENLPEQSEN